MGREVMIKLDKIKLIRQKTNADYSEAMKVLNNCNEDVYKAITTIKARGNLTKAEEQYIIKKAVFFKGKKIAKNAEDMFTKMMGSK